MREALKLIADIASGSTTANSLQNIAKIAQEALAQPEQRACNNSECGWSGTTDRMLGSIGPLCPNCGETTEAAQPEQMPVGFVPKPNPWPDAPQQAQPEQEPVGYVQTVIEALYENGDPISVDAAELLQRISAQPEQEPVAFICQGNVYMADDVDEYCTATHIPLYTKEQL